VTQTTHLLGVNFYVWLLFANFYKRTKFEACILHKVHIHLLLQDNAKLHSAVYRVTR